MKLSNILFFLLFILTNHEAFASNIDLAGRIDFEEQISCFQSSFQKLEKVAQQPCFKGCQVFDLSSDLAGVCNQALRLTRKELEEKDVDQERFTLLERFDEWVKAKIQSQILSMSDVKTLFYQLAFLRGIDNQQSDYAKSLMKRSYPTKEQSDWWQDENHVTFQNFNHLLFPCCHEMFLIPDQDCSFVPAYLRAFIKEPKAKIILFSFGQEQQPFLDPTDTFFRQMERPGIINWFRDSTESLDVLSKVTQKLWVEDDSLSTACLYLLIRDFMIDKDDLVFNENLEESKEEQFFCRWVEECFARVKSPTLGKETIAVDFLEYLKQRMNEDSDQGVSISLGREVQKEEGKLIIPVHMSFMNQTNSLITFPPIFEEPNCAILDLVVNVEKKSDLIEDYKVISWDNWRDPRVESPRKSRGQQ